MAFCPFPVAIDLQREGFRSRLAQIEARLLDMPLFRECGADEIQDLRYPSAKPMKCKNRPQLVQEMGRQLFAEGFVQKLHEAAPEDLRHFTVEAFYHLQAMWHCFVTLRHTRALSDTALAQAPYIHQHGIHKAFESLEHVVYSFTDADLEKCKSVISLRFDASPLAASLYQLVRTHVPTCLDLARYYALAAILVAFELEPGDPSNLDIVAKRLRTRVQRHKGSKPQTRVRRRPRQRVPRPRQTSQA